MIPIRFIHHYVLANIYITTAHTTKADILIHPIGLAPNESPLSKTYFLIRLFKTTVKTRKAVIHVSENDHSRCLYGLFACASCTALR